MIVVSNATPLITLAAVGQFDLLCRLFTELTISEAVWREVVVQGAGRFGALETSEANWIQVVPVTDSVRLSAWESAYNLGAGELSSILLAKELSATLVLMDERKARRLAAREGLVMTGSIALLESGYRMKYVTDLRQVYSRLLAVNFRVARNMLNRSLAKFELPPL